METTAVQEFKFSIEHQLGPSRSGLRRYGVAVATIAAVFIVRHLLSPVLGEELPFMFSSAAILFVAWYGGWGPGLTALLLGTLVGAYFMIGEASTAGALGRVDELRVVRYLTTAILGIVVIEALHRSKRQVQLAAEQVARHAERLETEVTERKRSEAALQEAKTQLSRHAQDLEARVNARTADLRESVEALEGVLYHVAHDLRAPLRAMEGFTSLMLTDHSRELDPQVADYTRRVSEAAARMDQLLQGLLEYGRLGHVEVKCGPVNLQPVVAAAVTRLEAAIKASGADVAIEGSLPEVWANPETAELALLHVIKNALTFVAPWTTPCVRIRATTVDNKVRLWIEDNGIGIDPEYHHRIFWIFERLRSVYPGMGIGLAIAAKAMQRMRGRIGVESVCGKGSKFWLEFAAGSDIPV